MADIAIIKRGRDRARERSEIERRRTFVARRRWLEANETAAEIVAGLERLKPPIVASIRTVERDFTAIRDHARQYLTARNFDGRFEVGEALARHELIARVATRRALENEKNGARWARAAIAATQARTALLQEIGLLDRQIGRLIVDDGQRQDRIPSGVEMAEMFRDVNVSGGDLTSTAERAYLEGDWAAAADGPDRRD